MFGSLNSVMCYLWLLTCKLLKCNSDFSIMPTQAHFKCLFTLSLWTLSEMAEMVTVLFPGDRSLPNPLVQDLQARNGSSKFPEAE